MFDLLQLRNIKILVNAVKNYKLCTNPDNFSIKKRGLLILATGTSANIFWNNENIRKKFRDYEILCMNDDLFMCRDKIFKIRPKYIALIDPAYWGVSHTKNRKMQKFTCEWSEKVIEVLETIDWPIYLVTSMNENFDLNNKNVTKIRLNNNRINTKSTFVDYLYSKNMLNPGLNNVCQAAIYFGIIFHYKKIALLGADYDMFKYIDVNIHNQCIEYTRHHYDDNESLPVGILNNYYRKGRVIADYLQRNSDSLNIFADLSEFANRKKCKIVNLSPNSMIDSFKRADIGVDII